MNDPLWFTLRHRGKKPSIFVRDDLYMPADESNKVDNALRLIGKLTNTGYDLIGVKAIPGKRITYRRFPGIVRPEIVSALTEVLGEPGKMPNDLEIPGYFEKNKG